jgi:predicted nucleotidyltransferase
MYQQFNRYKILRVFFDEPNKKFQLRELSRITGIALPSVKKHIEELLEQRLIKKTSGEIYEGYKSSFSNKYRILKRNDLLLRLEESKLIKEIENRCTPNCIVLYGSAVEGMDDERGDVDIFIQSIKKDVELKNYENILKRKINLLFEPYMEKIDNKLKNSLANGIVLHGFLKVI